MPAHPIKSWLGAVVTLGLLTSFAVPSRAQGTTGSIEGKVADELGLALPGAAATAYNVATGFSRWAMSDFNGLFRIPGLPAGTYRLKVELSGFGTSVRRVVVNVGATVAPELRLKVAGQTEDLTVSADTPVIDPSDSGVGEIVTGGQIDNLPLNGRQFGNLAALVPGVSLGFHTDPTKSTQFAPQVNGGGGRNVNYVIDGGDNNDDTVGGLVQLFPLDSIGEFNFETQRFRADTGRSNGGTIKVVTKSGTNELHGAAFELYRDRALNARTTTEENNGHPKGDYRRHQFGLSVGGPIVRDRAHFFAAFERTHQDTTQSVTTQGIAPDKDGVFETPYRENLAVAKVTYQFRGQDYLSVRYGYNDNQQPYGAGPLAPPENWGLSKNQFHSANANLNTALSRGRLNELVFQFSYFRNSVLPMSDLPTEVFPNRVILGQSLETPQTTLQKKYQVRDDFTWMTARHQLKVGASFIYEPVLDVSFSTGRQPKYTHLDDRLTSKVSHISYNGSIGGEDGESLGRIPNRQYSIYFQDSFRVTSKLLLDLGLRYDLVTGFAFDQQANVIFAELQAAGRAGAFEGSALPCPCRGLEDFGQEPAEDKNNFAPRVGATFDVLGNGRLIARGGAGRYVDFAYTNANILFAVIGAQSAFGKVYENANPTGIKNADGSYFQVGQPLPPNQYEPTVALPLQAASPRIKQPYQDQANLGLAYELGRGYAVELEGVYSRGRDLGVQPNLNLLVEGKRRFLGILPQSGGAGFRIGLSDGVAHYQGLTVAVRKRWDGRLQVMGWYTLSKATSSASLKATDEFIDYNAIDMFDPFQERQEAVTQTDARHRFTLSGTYSTRGGLSVSPVFRYRSKTPYNVVLGVDVNKDGSAANDFPPGVTTFNSARGADFAQLDVRLAQKFNLGRRLRLSAIAEVFNVLGADNPAGFVGNLRSSEFGKPTAFAGDFQRGEQRMGQIGLRFEF